MPLKLTVYPADLPGRQVILLEGRSYLLGRLAAADIVVPDGRVSGQHLIIDGRGEVWRISDKGSKNGTRINGRPLDVARIRASAWLNIGGVPAFAEPQDGEKTRADEQTQASRRAVADSLGRQLQGARAARTVLKRCLAALLQLSGCERAGIWIPGASGALRPLMLQGAARPRPGLSVMQQVVDSGSPCVVSDTTGAEIMQRQGTLDRGGIRALVVLPLKSRGRCTGVLYADSLSPGKTFTELDIELLSGVAAQTSVALAVSRLRDELDLLAESPLMPD